MTKKQRAGLLGAVLGITVLFGFTAVANIAPVGAQTTTVPVTPRLTIPPLPPTFPCPLCGPSGQRGNGTTAWVYPLHFCPNEDGSAEFAIIYGLGRLYDDSPDVTFFGSIQGITRQLMTLIPGDETAEYPTVNVQPGQQFLLSVWATTDGTQGGPRVTFGNGTTLRELVLICECPTPQTLVTTVPTTTGTTIATTVPAGTTTPGSPTSINRTTVPGQLPETGNGDAIFIIIAGGLVVAYFGWLLLVHTKPMEE